MAKEIKSKTTIGTIEAPSEEQARLARAVGDASHETGPVPEGKLFSVQGYDASGVAITTAGDFACGEALVHGDAISKCKVLNDLAAEKNASFWFGVTHAPIEAK